MRKHTTTYEACCSSELLLNKREYQYFLRRYYLLNGLSAETVANDYAKFHNLAIENQTDIRPLAAKAFTEHGYILSMFAGSSIALDAEKLRFTLTKIIAGAQNPIQFAPYMVGGTPNIQNTGPYQESALHGTYYLIFAKHEANNISTYTAYMSILQEMQQKCKNYLPKNFGWDDHLGRMRYVQVHKI